MTYDIIRGTRKIDVPSSHLQCHCWVGELLGDALLSAPFLVCISLCLLYNQSDCLHWFMLRNTTTTSSPGWSWGPAGQETPEMRAIQKNAWKNGVKRPCSFSKNFLNTCLTSSDIQEKTKLTKSNQKTPPVRGTAEERFQEKEPKVPIPQERLSVRIRRSWPHPLV